MVLDVRIRICVLYEYKLNHPPAVAISNLNRAFGSEACSRRTVYRLYSRFRSGNEDLDDEEFMPIADDELMTAVEKEPEVSKSELARRFCVTRRTIRPMPPLDRQVKVCILYEYKLGNAADLAFLNVNRAFGDGTVTNATVHRWFSQFQDGEESLDREPTAELEYGEDGIEEDPVIVEALLARQFGLEPGTLHMHLDVLGRGEKLKEARDAQQRGGGKNATAPKVLAVLTGPFRTIITFFILTGCRR
ncbi:unnamed protein product [Heligmosomoides polygyrus]|uniref:HTH_48 domain-containing protein n=1 Tax=Heligmosomoides polygyrus TaxID=6339 RepID=A0A3P8BGC6_HELPZ|nr:unnamed protein product [Heligmosomoides polygyrus]